MPMRRTKGLDHRLTRRHDDDRPASDLPAPVLGRLLVVMALLLVQAIGNLYLPDLNGDIINNGVAKGDNDYILRIGGLMLVVTAAAGRRLDHRGLPRRADRDGLRARRPQRDLHARSRASRQVEVNHFGPASLITRNTNDVQQVQTVVFMAPDGHGLRADPDRRRDHHGRPPGRSAVGAARRRAAADGRSSSGSS